jgi:hypothetical protein
MPWIMTSNDIVDDKWRASSWSLWWHAATAAAAAHHLHGDNGGASGMLLSHALHTHPASIMRCT